MIRLFKNKQAKIKKVVDSFGKPFEPFAVKSGIRTVETPNMKFPVFIKPKLKY